MKIAICDDERIDRDLIVSFMKEIEEKIRYKLELDVYEDGKQLLNDLEEKEWDALFLDIDMPQLNGMKIAEIVQNKFPYIKIVFITNRADLVFDTIRFCPFRFVRKENLRMELTESIIAMDKRIAQESFLFQFKNGNQMTKIRISDIKYIESQKHNLELHYNNDSIKVRAKVSEYEKRLLNYGFVRIHKGFIVNMKYIKILSSKYVILDDGTELVVGVRFGSMVKEKYADYIRRYLHEVE